MLTIAHFFIFEKFSKKYDLLKFGTAESVVKLSDFKDARQCENIIKDKVTKLLKHL